MRYENMFWMVYGWGQGAPTVRHMTEDSAIAEARRLSRANAGVRFFVLASVKGFQLADPVEAIEIIDPDRPF